MADNLNGEQKTSNRTVLSDNHTKIEAYDSKDFSDILKSNVALQELVRKYNETGINVVSLLYNQQVKGMYPFAFEKMQFIHALDKVRGKKLKI